MINKERFRPFDPQRHEYFQLKLSSLDESCFPSSKIRRGYSEIHLMYQENCKIPVNGFDKTLERAFLRPRNEATSQDRDAARDLAAEIGRSLVTNFRSEVRSMLSKFNISELSYSIVTLDVSFRRHSKERAPLVFALVEVRDGNLNPMIVRGRSAESFSIGPVAYVLSQDRDTQTAQPILTMTAAKECIRWMADTLEDGGVKRLLRPIRSSVVFSLICDAIAFNLDGNSFIANQVTTSMSSQRGMLDTSSMNDEISKSVRSITEVVSPRGIASYVVRCKIDGAIEEFTVSLKRNYKTGKLSASVV